MMICLIGLIWSSQKAEEYPVRDNTYFNVPLPEHIIACRFCFNKRPQNHLSIYVSKAFYILKKEHKPLFPAANAWHHRSNELTENTDYMTLDICVGNYFDNFGSNTKPLPLLRTLITGIETLTSVRSLTGKQYQPVH